MYRWALVLVFCKVLLVTSASRVESDWKIYYDIRTNKTIEVIDSDNPRVQYYKAQAQKLQRVGFGPIPCSCQELTCGCCAGMNIEYFNFNQRACMNFTYDPEEFSLKLDMLMNDNSVFAQSISGRNPPPACMPFPIPYLPSIDLCVRFFNIHTPGYNIFMCIDFETRIERAPVLVLHFDCMRMGMDGISYHKPEDAEFGPDIEDADTGVQNGEESEVYDEVFEDDANITTKAPEKSCEGNTVIHQLGNGTKKPEEVYDEVIEDDTTQPVAEATTEGTAVMDSTSFSETTTDLTTDKIS